MSYREIRNFTEIMKSLGYPRLISMENFRKPNFELVADILYWMVKLYDPETTVSDRVEFENERVEFLTSIAKLMAAKARLKLNTKKLYASDGRAVQELLKFATLLYKATRAAQSSKSSLDETLPPSIKVHDVKTARTLASDITQSGAKLFDFLQNEVAERSDRLRSLRFLELPGVNVEGSREYAFIERSIRDIIDNTKQNVEDLRKESEELEADEKNLESKIRKKQEELERTEKRLRSLENVRPQFMDEVEKLEKELQYHYDIYMEKYRNLDYLEHELEKFHKAEDERRQEHEKKLQKIREKLYREEVQLLRGENGGATTKRDDMELNLGSLFGPKSDAGAAQANHGRPMKGHANSNRGVSMQGTMHGNVSDEDDDEEEDDEDEDEDEEDDEELSVSSRNRNRGDSTGYAGDRRGYRGNGRNESKTGSDSDDLVDDDEDEDEDDGMSGDHNDSDDSEDAF